MRVISGALAVLLLLAVLTWLLMRGFATNAASYATILQALDDFALAQASLHRDVLQARAGLLRNYDPLVKAVDAMHDAAARLHARAKTDGVDTGPVDRLAETVAQQEQLTDRFKSRNALLQNSLSYVGLLSTSPTFGPDDAQVTHAAGALAAAILYLTRDTSQDAVKALQERIDQFAAQAPTAGPGVDSARALLAHARLLRDLLPAVDETLQTLVAVPSRQLIDEIHGRFSNHQSAVEATAQRYRLLLYLVSLALLVMLAYLGLRLRKHALALRRRSAFERVIAENSTRLINCLPGETDARLNQVLGQLGQAIGVERAYVVLNENPNRIRAWCASGTTYPPGWPRQALTLFSQLGAAEHDIVTVPNVAALPPGTTKDTLAAAGVRSWICAPLVRPGRMRGILGFDSVRPGWDGAYPPPVVRLASDAVAGAIERDFLERDRAKLATRLERARRMQVVGSLASGIAHNFNNIIAAILGYSEMVEPQLTPGTKPAQHVDEIRRAAERGRDLIDNILTFGRRRDARVRPLQVHTLFEEAASLLRASLPPNIELIIEDVPEDAAVSGERAQLQQVILNLCTNAAQAMSEGGAIRLAAEQKDALDYVPTSHGVATPGRYVCLTVADTGCGFDERVARQLFEPFFTTRLAGTGLGLATVREIIRDHDGTINVRSKLGLGSRFEVWLPAAPADSAAGAGASTLPLGRGETVLIVEVDREELLGDEEMLAALGYEPVGFERPADAIEACRSTPDRFDVLLVSHASQNNEGLDLAHTLHEIAPRQPLLLATASTVDISIDALAEAGISEVLRRPLGSTELAETLARCLRSPAAVRP